MTNKPSPPARSRPHDLPEAASATSLLDLVPMPLLLVEPRHGAKANDALEHWRTRANTAWIQLCGNVPQQDPTVADWLATTYPDAPYRAEVGAILQSALREGLEGPTTRYELSTLLRCASGDRRWLEIVSEIGPDSRSGFVVMLRDPQHRQAHPAMAEPTPTVRGDPLSGLPDRRTALDRIELEWNRFKRSGTLFSLVLFEIDRLDVINRDFGTPTEEFVVRQIAAALRNASRVIDAVARWGDGGFLLVASATSGRDAAALAERMRRAVEALGCNWYGHPIPLTISASFACIREGQAWQTLLSEVVDTLASRGETDTNSVYPAMP